VKLRVVVGILLLLVGIGLPLAAMSSNGPPWGFRGHQAVVVEVTGTVEGTMSEGRRAREQAIDDKLAIGPNARLDVGDEIRVARLSQARLRLEGADVVVGDGVRLVLAPAGIRLTRGLVDVVLREGARMFTVELETGGSIILRGVGASARILADGKGGAVAWVSDGSLEGRTARGEILGEPGRELIIRGDEASVADRRSTLTVSATCSSQKLNVVAPALTQVFAAGALAYPDVAAGADTGSIIIDVDAGTTVVPVLVRDIHGQLGRANASCGRK
jgi:hypothetical protein